MDARRSQQYPLRGHLDETAQPISQRTADCGCAERRNQIGHSPLQPEQPDEHDTNVLVKQVQ
jgi:hypothetical protein